MWRERRRFSREFSGEVGRSGASFRPKFQNWNGSGRPRDGSAGFLACCIAGFQTRKRWNSSNRSEPPMPCRLGSRRYSRLGNLRYKAPRRHLGIRVQLAVVSPRFRFGGFGSVVTETPTWKGWRHGHKPEARATTFSPARLSSVRRPWLQGLASLLSKYPRRAG